MTRFALIAPIATVAALAAGSASAEAHTYDLNGDGMLDFAELSAVVGEARAMDILRGNADTMVPMTDVNPSVFDTRAVSDDGDDPDYRTQDEPIGFVDDDEDGIDSGFSDNDDSDNN